MKRFRFTCLFLILVSTVMLAKSNPVPLINQPLVPTSVAPGSGGFTLTVNGAAFVSGSLVYDNAVGSPQTVALSGIGVSAVEFSPTSVDFGNQNVGTTSVPIPITLTNRGPNTLSITQIAIKGSNAGDFAQTSDCGNSVPSGGHCTITVTFTPTVKGPRSAKVSVSDDGGGSPQTVPLSGTGT